MRQTTTSVPMLQGSTLRRISDSRPRGAWADLTRD